MPDIIANAGGVISSYAEYRGENPQRMFEMVEEKIVKNVRSIIKKAEEEEMTLRDAGLGIAQERVRKAMEKRKLLRMRKSKT